MGAQQLVMTPNRQAEHPMDLNEMERMRRGIPPGAVFHYDNPDLPQMRVQYGPPHQGGHVVNYPAEQAHNFSPPNASISDQEYREYYVMPPAPQEGPAAPRQLAEPGSLSDEGELPPIPALNIIPMEKPVFGPEPTPDSSIPVWMIAGGSSVATILIGVLSFWVYRRTQRAPVKKRRKKKKK